MSDWSDPPIKEQNFLVKQVVDIGDYRVARGISRRPHSLCLHNNLMYDPAERRIWCSDCERTLDPFDAFMGIVERFQTISRVYDARLKSVEMAESSLLHRIAAKALDKIWAARMAAVCPHCRGALTADDMRDPSRTSLEIEMQRRARKKDRL